MKRTLLLTAIGSFYLTSFAQNEKLFSRPNLIFVFSDQQSFDMLGCYGNKQIKTPNIDKLASKGVLFNHCISNCPVSTPYRSMLLTGLHPLKNGAITNDVRIIESTNRNYFGEVLSDAGYHTGYYGKWHLYGGDRDRPVPKGPYRYGFDDEFLTNNCTMTYDPAHAWYWDEEGNRKLYGDWEWNTQTKQAIEFINEYANDKEKPFALFLSWHAPHNWEAGRAKLEHKYSAPQEFEEMYDPKKITLRENCKDTPLRRKYYQGHMAMISNLDKNFGQLINALEKNGSLDNSIIIFTADHGDMLESHEWKHNKGCPEIESIKVPLIIYYGNKLRSRQSELLIGSLDLMPTILGLLNLDVPKECDGINLSDAIIKENDDVVKSVPLFYFTTNWRGVYTKDYTYAFSLKNIKKLGRDYNVLYSHNKDPRELNNLFNDDNHNIIKNRLHSESLKWMAKFGDKGRLFSDIFLKSVKKEDRRNAVTSPKDRPKGCHIRLQSRPLDVQ